MRQFLFFVCVFNQLSSFALGFSERRSSLDVHQIETLVGMKGEMDLESGTFRLLSPNKNLKATTIGVQLSPTLGLSSWVEFKPLPNSTKMKGELVLLEDQVNLILGEALNQDLKVTALHNEYLWDSPRLMVMSIEGEGETKDLAFAVAKIFEVIRTSTTGSLWRRGPSFINPEKSTLTLSSLEDFFAKKGSKKEGVTQFEWNDDVKARAFFAGTDRDAVLLGHIVMKKENVQKVLKILVSHTFLVMFIGPQNQDFVTVRYLGRAAPLELAKFLKEALNEASPLKETN